MSSRDTLYAEAVAEYGPALSRLARAYEADAEKRQDLLQDIHLQLWRSLDSFDGRCSLRTWIYRIAHHTATSHVIRERRTYASLVSLEAIDNPPEQPSADDTIHRQDALERLSAIIQQLKPLDRQVIVSYLEGLDAAATAEITGLSPANVAMKIHRIKNMLARRFRAQGGSRHAG
ncbi:MAG TPA: sigma-70 family RNA polymerase sigma factor [Bryobacteraceae bacterium]|nr:sigma-70 family RNA polymerase sigma factor [Bryobacteraceae bacterium]